MESVLQFITVLFIFIFVLLITYLTTRWLAGLQKNQYMGKNIELLDAGRLNQNQYIQLVRVGKRYMILGISKDHIVMLGELQEDELNLEDASGISIDSGQNFGKLLEQAKKIMPHK